MECTLDGAQQCSIRLVINALSHLMNIDTHSPSAHQNNLPARQSAYPRRCKMVAADSIEAVAAYTIPVKT
jgi:hypothetical protein